jgi:hypothetical protein
VSGIAHLPLNVTVDVFARIFLNVAVRRIARDHFLVTEEISPAFALTLPMGRPRTRQASSPHNPPLASPLSLPRLLTLTLVTSSPPSASDHEIFFVATAICDHQTCFAATAICVREDISVAESICAHAQIFVARALIAHTPPSVAAAFCDRLSRSLPRQSSLAFILIVTTRIDAHNSPLVTIGNTARGVSIVAAWTIAHRP